MADSRNTTSMPEITRRKLLASAASAAPILILPAAAVAAAQPQEPEHPWVTARRLAHELSEALARIEIHEIASGSHVAVIYPKGHQQGVGFASLDYYDEAWSRNLTPEQAEVIADWQTVTIEANEQWDVYCSFKRRGAESEAAYARWREIYDRQQDAHTSMIRALSPTRQIEREADNG